MTEEDRRRDGLEMGMRWSWSTLRQIQKLHTLEDQLKKDALKKDAPEGQSQHFGYQQRLPFWELRTEIHFCFIAARNMVHALQYLDPPAETIGFPHLPVQLITHLTTLRNCFEHWDERENAENKHGVSGRAYRELAQLGVGDRDEYRFGAGGTTVGGLSLDELESTSETVHAYLRNLELSSFVWQGWNSASIASA